MTNQQLRQLKARISKLQHWLKEAAETAEPPILADMVRGILPRQEQDGPRSRSRAVSSLKAAADMLNFLTENGIQDMAGLEEKVKEMHGRQRGIAGELKPLERRLKTLDEHILNAERYMQYRDIHRQYRQQKPRKQEAFYESHRAELIQYESAERYLKAIMNGKTPVPLGAWKQERDKLKSERQQLFRQYSALKDEVKEVELIRRNMYDIVRQELHREKLKSKHELAR